MNANAKTIVLAVSLLAAAGCWEEIRYEPKNLPDGPNVSPVAQVDEPEENADSGTTVDGADAVPQELKPVEAEELFGDESEPISEEPVAPPVVAEPDEDLNWLEDSPEPTPAVPLFVAWTLGSKWSLAVCIFGRGYSEDRYAGEYDSASAVASELQVSLPSMPGDVDGDLSDRDKLSWAIDTLLRDAGPSLAESVGANHSRQHRALCELAIGTHVLLLNYLPNREGVEPSAATLRTLAHEAQLPEEIWLPVITALEDRAEFNDLKVAVLKLHREAASHLSALGVD